jgi:predicted RNA methylase
LEQGKKLYYARSKRIVDSNIYDRYNVGFDIDPDAIKVAQENSETFEVDIDFVNTDLTVATLDGFKGKLDTIIMNPPFGTKNNKGVDMVLLKKAIEVIEENVNLHEFLLNRFLDCKHICLFATQNIYKRGKLFCFRDWIIHIY